MNAEILQKSDDPWGRLHFTARGRAGDRPSKQRRPKPRSRMEGEVTSVGRGDCPLVMGECVQGWLDHCGHFLITSPVDVVSRAEFVADLTLGEVKTDPPEKTKSRIAVTRYLEAAGLPVSGRLKVLTPLEPGQGFGTSTADIAASVRAAACAWGENVSSETISKIAIGIEPSDGSMYHGSVAYAHRQGLLLERLGLLPPFHVLAICTDGGVDTMAFDNYREHFRYSQEDQREFQSAWEMVRRAVQKQDVSILARAATISARINEQLLHKRFFRELSEFVECSGAEGIMAAHSGSVLALIFDPRVPGFRKQLKQAIRFVEQLRPQSWLEISHSELRLGDDGATVRPQRRWPSAVTDEASA